MIAPTRQEEAEFTRLAGYPCDAGEVRLALKGKSDAEIKRARDFLTVGRALEGSEAASTALLNNWRALFSIFMGVSPGPNIGSRTPDKGVRS